MKCPFCKEKKLKSKVYFEHGSMTLLFCPPYFDEHGRHHEHDVNALTDHYACSNGHKWHEKYYRKCPSCKFNSDKERQIVVSG